MDVTQRRDAERDVGRIQPVMRDRRLGDVERRGAVRERGRPQRGLAGIAAIYKDAVALRERVAEGRRHLHHQIVRMLAVDQGRLAVGGLAACQQQRIAAVAHERLRAQHEAQIEHVVRAEIAPRHAHDPARREPLRGAARPALAVEHAVQQRMSHQAPAAEIGHEPVMRHRVRLPARPRRLARRRVWSKHAGHRHSGHVHVGHAVHAAARLGKRRRGDKEQRAKASASVRVQRAGIAPPLAQGYDPPIYPHGVYRNREDRLAEANRKMLSRLARIEGQVRGVSRMVEEDRYCIDILNQMQAVKSALQRVEEEILKNHAAHCVAHAIRSGSVKDQTEKFSELVELFSRYGK